ncbi:MAG: hypothetical protein GY747_03915 [Planctomycetes bacterium]|nr:hypothetical protein [Planctomycetota bacterium]MCP4770950.1 hypothetical protein [Planctomycetota bacterium]MCP4861670.1 hypothetical protein [Planctomycetota bacterium]
MTVDLLARVVFVTADEAPPAEVVRLVEHPRGVAEGRELDSFLAELDAGQDVPGLLVAVGGTKVIETLRRHERTACLPIFCWGSGARVAPGWDGNVVSWNENQLALAAAWQKTLATARPVAELQEQERREHLFLRYLASRGVASLACMDVFGLEFTEGALSRWQRNKWIEQVGTERLQATTALQEQIWGSKLAELPPVPPVPEVEAAVEVAPDDIFELVTEAVDQPFTAAVAPPAAKESPAPVDSIPGKEERPAAEMDAEVKTPAKDVATVHADVVASLLQDSQARERSMPTPSAVVVERRRGFGFRDVLLLALLGFIVFDLWKRYGRDYFYPPALVKQEQVEEPVQPPSMVVALPPAPPPELSLDAHLSWEILDYSAPAAGVLAWRLPETNRVQKGDVIAHITQASAVEAPDLDALQAQLDEVYSEIADLQTLANSDAATRIVEARSAVSDAKQAETNLTVRVAELNDIYQRQLKLAQDGILSFREIRSDWENLQAAKEQLAQAATKINKQQAIVETALAYEVPRVAEDPLWQSRIEAIQLRMKQPQVAATTIPVVAQDSGLFVRRIPENGSTSAGEVVGQLRKSASGQVEAVLATADWDPIYLQGVARLRRPQRSSWMPTKILAAESLPTGLTLLRLRLPVGWLDGSDGISLENASQLELRITAPLSSVHESK